ncbi:MAG: Rnase Y domain-containing protein, partial [Gemmatimonas sp.]
MGDVPVLAPVIGAVVAVVAAVVAFVIGRKTGGAAEIEHQRRAKATAAETTARMLEEATRDADSVRKSAVVAGKEEVLKLREEFEKEARQRRVELEKEEKRVQDREGQIDRTRDSLVGREQEVQRLHTELGKREAKVGERVAELDGLIADERHKLEQLAGLSAQDAKNELMRRLEDEAHASAASKLREIRETAKKNAERDAKKIVALAVQRV